MTIEELKDKKTTLGLTNEMIASSAGIPLSTVQKIMSGATKAPRKSTLVAIETVLSAEEHRRKDMAGMNPDRIKANAYGDMTEAYGSVKDPTAGYKPSPEVKKKDGEYTLDDYYALPDERRVELIDGVFYDMSAPAVIHQKILGELFLLFRECTDAHEGECEVYLSPCDVRLDRDNKTMVQPDLLVICEAYDLSAKRFEGAPDLVLEILSPSTRSKDMLLKLYKYQNAGVKEYWIVDPDHETVMVYDFREDNFYPEKYDFDSVIPIHISGGQCSIDFSRVNRALKKVRSANST
ncbi:MAG: Uma2 family endonuclease [Lachnospiraceae bacterium]|nr:Uma2 family endonuclease [Lachnospiraceae bacterium]